MKQKLSIECKLPDTSYSLKIQEVHEVGNKLICISKLTSKGSGGEAIVTRKDSIEVDTHYDNELPVKHYIIMPRFNKGHWARKSTKFTAIDDMNEVLESIDVNSVLYKINIIQNVIYPTDKFKLFQADQDHELQKSMLDLDNISQTHQFDEYRGPNGEEYTSTNVTSLKK